SLAASVDFGYIERGEDTLGCREPGHEVSNGGTNLVRWSIAWSGQIHYSGLALHDYIVAGSILLRSAVAKTRWSNRSSLGVEPSQLHSRNQAVPWHRAESSQPAHVTSPRVARECPCPGSLFISSVMLFLLRLIERK